MSVRKKSRTGPVSRRRLIGVGAVGTTAALLVGYTAFSAQAFTPIRPYAAILGNSTSHTSMSDTAVEALDKEFFAVSELTETMKKARNEIHDANAEMDEEANQQPVNHFDSEALVIANQRLIKEADEVKSRWTRRTLRRLASTWVARCTRCRTSTPTPTGSTWATRPRTPASVGPVPRSVTSPGRATRSVPPPTPAS